MHSQLCANANVSCFGVGWSSWSLKGFDPDGLSRRHALAEVCSMRWPMSHVRVFWGTHCLFALGSHQSAVAWAGRWRTCLRPRRSTTMCIHIRCRVRVVGARLPNPRVSPPMRPHCPGMGLVRRVRDVLGVVAIGHSCRRLHVWCQYGAEFYEEFPCNGNGATC